ncbi:MAG: hypothetical protein KJ066_08525 [Acidobacteria bacterium]|nr:hypothetical protein [Acidobacteriota bacterium]
MKIVSSSRAACRYRVAPLAAVVLGLALSASPALAQEEPAQEQPAQPQVQALTMSSGAGVLFHQIKADRTDDFNWVMNRLKEALHKSEDPSHQQQAAGIKVFKSTDPPQNGNVTYMVLINPTVKDADYGMQGLLMLLYKAFPEEQQEIFTKVNGTFGGPTSRVNLDQVADFSK